MDPQWSETGDRYFLKLFRDYVFHQVDGENRPVLDIGHVIQCLNKVFLSCLFKPCTPSQHGINSLTLARETNSC